jgi:hypothetical protein
MHNQHHWKTAITSIKPNEIRLRGFRIDELMGRISFSQAIYLTLTGELPSPQVGQLLDAIFVSSIDHGASPPSTLAARTAASTGAPFNAALVDGVANVYLSNLRAVSALANEYDFQFFAFLQPVLPLKDKPDNPEQQMFLWDMPGGLPELFREVYPRWQNAAQTEPYLHDLSNVLDGQPYPVWIDFNHLTPWGNLAVSDAMLKVIRPSLEG